MATTTKIVSVEPKMENGEQRSSNSANGIIYYYLIEFENRWKGEVASKSGNVYPMPVGSVVEVTEKHAASGNRAAYFSVKKVKDAEPAPGETPAHKGGFDDPTQTLRVAMGICQEITIKAYGHRMIVADNPIELHEMAQLFFNWICDNGRARDRASVTLRWYALRNAVETMEVMTADKFKPNPEMNDVAEYSSTNIILMAERWLKQLEDIK